MPDGSEFHTVGTATLKPWEANAVRTRGTDSRLGQVGFSVQLHSVVSNVGSSINGLTEPETESETEKYLNDTGHNATTVHRMMSLCVDSV